MKRQHQKEFEAVINSIIYDGKDALARLAKNFFKKRRRKSCAENNLIGGSKNVKKTDQLDWNI